MDGNAVLSGDGDLDLCGAVFYLYVNTLAYVLGCTEGLADGAHHASAAATEGVNAGNLAGCNAGDLGNNDVINGGGAVLSLQVVVPLALFRSGNVVLRVLCRSVVLRHGL